MSSSTAACSARKLKANRRNARKSTGPRTAEGKERSARNATGYGIFCQGLVLPGEDRQMFDLLRTSLIHEHRPQNVTELFLIDRMASAMWRLRRIQAAEADAHGAMEQQILEEAARVRRKLEGQMQQYAEDDAEAAEAADDADELDEHDRRKRQRTGERLRDYEALTEGGQVPASVTAHRLIGDGQGKLSTLEKLSLYEKRLEGTIHRCLRDLKKLRTPAKGERVPAEASPWAAEVREEEEAHSNESSDSPKPLSPALSPGRGEGAEALAGQGVAGAAAKMKNEATVLSPADRQAGDERRPAGVSPAPNGQDARAT